MSRSSKLKSNKLVDQETIHVRILITSTEETIQIFLEDHNQWLALLYLNPNIRTQHISIDHTTNFKMLLIRLPLVIAQLLKKKF